MVDTCVLTRLSRCVFYPEINKKHMFDVHFQSIDNIYDFWIALLLQICLPIQWNPYPSKTGFTEPKDRLFSR